MLLAGGGLAALAVLMGDDDSAPAGDDTGTGDDDTVPETPDEETASVFTISFEDGDSSHAISDHEDDIAFSYGSTNSPPADILRVRLEDGNDTLNVDSSAGSDRVEVYAGSGDDVVGVDLDGKDIVVHGGEGNDGLFGRSYGTSNVTLMGDGGDDYLSGKLDLLVGGGRDLAPGQEIVLDGGAGNDTLIAAHNGTSMTGGEGSDIFKSTVASNWVWSEEPSPERVMNDFVVTDFEPGVDQLHLDPFTIRDTMLDGDRPAYTRQLLTDIEITEGPDGTVVSAFYDGSGYGDFTHTITLQGVTGVTRDDIVIDAWTRNSVSEAVFEAQPGQSDAAAENVHIFGTDAAESWDVTNVDEISGHLGGGNDTLSVTAVATPDGADYDEASDVGRPLFDLINAGEGDDLVEFDFSARGVEGGWIISEIDGGTGNDTLTGFATNHRVIGGDGDDLIDISASALRSDFGQIEEASAVDGAGNDTITVAAGHNVYLSDDGETDHLTIIQEDDTGVSTVSGVTEDDIVTIAVPADMVDRVTADISSDNMKVKISFDDAYHANIATLHYANEVTGALIDPGNPDALIRVVSL